MNISYSWQITALTAHQTLTDDLGNAFHDVVQDVHWKLIGTDALGASAWVHGSVSLEVSLTPGFTLRHELTEDTIIGWVQTALGTNYIVEIKAQIESRLNADTESVKVDIQRRIAAGGGFADFVAERIDLSGIDLSGVDLTGATFFHSNLANANLAGANLTNADLRYSILVGADLTGAVLTGVDIREAQGNGKEIVTWYGRRRSIAPNETTLTTFTDTQLAVGCVQHPVEEWKTIDDRVLRVFMDDDVLAWHLSEAATYDVIAKHFENPVQSIPVQTYSWSDGFTFYPDDGRAYTWDRTTASWTLV